MNLIETIVAARNAGTPIAAVTSADQSSAIAAICEATDGAPKVQWDCVRGLKGINDAGERAIKRIDPEGDSDTSNPQTALEVLGQMPTGTISFMINAHRFIKDPFVATGVGNLRESYKALDGEGNPLGEDDSTRMLILTGPEMELPAELTQDVVIIDDPLPGDDQLRACLKNLCDQNGAPYTDESLESAVDATRGLAEFACEQTAAMTLRKSGFDLDALWERKRQQINQTPGLTMKRRAAAPRVTDVGGNKRMLDFTLAAVRKAKAIVFIDEIDKAFAGSGANGGPGDSNGITADQNNVLLKEMEDNGYDGILALSPPGCGKTLLALAVANETNKPMLVIDFGGMKDSLVGNSEKNYRQTFKVIRGVAGGGQGSVLVIATCNKLENLPPELRRRFTFGTFFIDLPTAGERDLIWPIQLQAHGFPLDSERPDDTDWTGAEIRNCCRIAQRLEITLAEAATYIVPVAQAAKRDVEALRNLADGTFNSAVRPGPYRKAGPAKADATTRKVRLA